MPIASTPCATFADLLVDLSDGELTANERQPVLHHLATCEHCRTHLARLDTSRDLLTAAITASNSPQPVEAYRSPPQKRPSLQKIALATAAILLLALSIAWLTTIKPPRRATTAQPAPLITAAPPKLTPSEALWQITLLEQQARLKTSLQFLPDSPAFADQRQQNEQLLTHYESLLTSSNLQ